MIGEGAALTKDQKYLTLVGIEHRAYYATLNPVVVIRFFFLVCQNCNM